MLTDVTFRLMAATDIIADLKKVRITGIQFEDGSGYKFNYTSVENPDWSFIAFDKRMQQKLEMMIRTLGMAVSGY